MRSALNIIDFRGVSKSYPVYRDPKDRLKELATLNRRSFHRRFLGAPRHYISGRPGRDLLRHWRKRLRQKHSAADYCRNPTPTTGDANVTGRVAALLELGSGFNPEFTGRENVYLNASILGLSQQEIDQRYPDIAAFAEIGDFIDQPVKTYSSGMTVRLAFAVAIHVDPEILLVDEALAVGDIYFRQRCMRKVHELRSSGVTILFVSHGMGDVKAIGDRCMWLDSGAYASSGRQIR